MMLKFFNNGEKKQENLKKSLCIALMGIIFITSISSVRIFARDVYVNADNNTIHAVTVDTDTNEILKRVGVEVSKDDKVDKIEDFDGSLKLNVTRAFNVTISQGEDFITVRMNEGTVEDALSLAGITLQDYDIANLNLQTKLTSDTAIEITHRVKITITEGGKASEYYVPTGTVRDALEYAKINISTQDLINVDAFSNVYENMNILINRITYQETSREEEIDFNTVVKKTNLLDNDSRKITCEGKKGTKLLTIKETLKDGQIVSSEIIKSEIIRKPVDEIVLEGNKSTTATPAKEEPKTPEVIPSKQVITGSATAYTAPPGARTSTGKKPLEGITAAVNPKVIPYGSKISVETTDGSYKKTLIAQDTGGALRSGSAVIDIYMANRKQCINFGRKNVVIRVLN